MKFQGHLLKYFYNYIIFKETYEIQKGKLDHSLVTADLLAKFPFLLRHIKENLEKYQKTQPSHKNLMQKKLQIFAEALKNLKALIFSIKNEHSSFQKAFQSLLKEFQKKGNRLEVEREKFFIRQKGFFFFNKIN